MLRLLPGFLRSSLPSLAVLALGLVVLVFGTGCGAARAVANPKVAWALNDPAPMSVVVRRADAAEKTSLEVDRLLTATPANLDSDWIQDVGPSPDAAAAELKVVSAYSFYVESKARVVPSEVWIRTLSAVKSAKGKYKSLLAAIDSDLADKYEKIVQKKQELAGIKSLIVLEQGAIDDDGTSAASPQRGQGKDATVGDKADHQKKKDDLQKMAEAADKEIGPLQTAFLQAAKDSAGKAAPEVREKLGVALVNLRQAVEDAQIANGAAALRYPMASTTVASSLKAVVPFIVADIIEEQTGKRPTLNKLVPDVGLDGTKVSLTLAGLEPSDIGKIKMPDLVTESVKRSTKWVAHAVTLLGAISSNTEALSFQADVLGAMVDGFAAGGWKVIVAAKIPGQDGSSGIGSLLGGSGDGGGSGKGGGKGLAPKVDTASLSGDGLKSAAKGAASDATKAGNKAATKVASSGIDKVANKAGSDVTKGANKVAADASVRGIDKAANKAGSDVTKGANKVAGDASVKGAGKAVTKTGNNAVGGAKKGLRDAFSP
jgi:hypothetical protein